MLFYNRFVKKSKCNGNVLVAKLVHNDIILDSSSEQVIANKKITCIYKYCVGKRPYLKRVTFFVVKEKPIIIPYTINVYYNKYLPGISVFEEKSLKKAGLLK